MAIVNVKCDVNNDIKIIKKWQGAKNNSSELLDRLLGPPAPGGPFAFGSGTPSAGGANNLSNGSLAGLLI